MGGWLIHGIELYPAKYSISFWKFGFIPRVDRDWITTKKDLILDLESWRFDCQPLVRALSVTIFPFTLVLHKST